VLQVYEVVAPRRVAPPDGFSRRGTSQATHALLRVGEGDRRPVSRRFELASCGDVVGRAGEQHPVQRRQGLLRGELGVGECRGDESLGDEDGFTGGGWHFFFATWVGIAAQNKRLAKMADVEKLKQAASVAEAVGRAILQISELKASVETRLAVSEAKVGQTALLVAACVDQKFAAVGGQAIALVSDARAAADALLLRRAAQVTPNGATIKQKHAAADGQIRKKHAAANRKIRKKLAIADAEIKRRSEESEVRIAAAENDRLEALFYTAVRVATSADIAAQVGSYRFFDLVDHEKLPRVLIKKELSLFALKQEIWRRTGALPEQQRLWSWVTRQNRTYRPDQPLQPGCVGHYHKTIAGINPPLLRICGGLGSPEINPPERYLPLCPVPQLQSHSELPHHIVIPCPPFPPTCPPLLVQHLPVPYGIYMPPPPHGVYLPLFDCHKIFLHF